MTYNSVNFLIAPFTQLSKPVPLSSPCFVEYENVILNFRPEMWFWIVSESRWKQTILKILGLVNQSCRGSNPPIFFYCSVLVDSIPFWVSTKYLQKHFSQTSIHQFMQPATHPQLTTFHVDFSINIIFSFIITWSRLNLSNNCFFNQLFIFILEC
jgi:hypothetical protein